MTEYEKGYEDGRNKEIESVIYYKEQAEFWHKAYDKLVDSLSEPQLKNVLAKLINQNEKSE